MNENETNTEDKGNTPDETQAEMPIDFGGELKLDRLSELEKELEEVRQHVLYAQAETQNVRRRLEQEKVNAAAYAATGFARDILSVKDNLERALQAIPAELREDEKMKGLVVGLEATGREIDSVFQRHGISRVEARSASPPGDDRGAERRCGARDDRSGDAGRLHAEGPAVAAGARWSRAEAITPIAVIPAKAGIQLWDAR